ncbi:MAG: hypothetical protein HY897_10380 [Deltaproteobacteria bacterium]|nr:hypothetical protein [Deltaproteobacteria bacterium]
MKSQRQEILSRRRSLHEKLRALSYAPLMRGSIVEVTRRCGRLNCACARDPGARHRSKMLSVNLDGRTRTLHLRPEDEEAVRRATEAYAQLWEVVNGLTACELADLKRLARERKRTRNRLRRA